MCVMSIALVTKNNIALQVCTGLGTQERRMNHPISQGEYNATSRHKSLQYYLLRPACGHIIILFYNYF
jgi:hypothetical protein